jgi:hypothetical protein
LPVSMRPNDNRLQDPVPFQRRRQFNQLRLGEVLSWLLPVR